MIKTEFDSRKNIAILTPAQKVSSADIAALRSEFDRYVNDHDAMPGVVIRVSGLPHWESLRALKMHLEFIHDHELVVPRVALVTDSHGLALLRVLAGVFIKARLRRFSAAHLDQAVEWAASEEDDPGHFELIEGLPHDILALQAYGIITAQDYSETLVPMIDELLRAHDRIKILVVLGEDFESYTGGAIWNDAKLGLTHLRAFSRLAVVTDHDWLRRTTMVLSPFVPARVKVFPLTGLEQAKEWIKW